MSEKPAFPGYYGNVLNEEQRGIIKYWWNSLEDERGDRARLRRCSEAIQVMLEPGFYRLLNALESWETYRIHALAMAAGLISHLKTNSAEKGVRFGHQLGKSKEGSSKPRISQLRFSQLQKCRNPEEFYVHVRRIIQLLDRNANVLSLAEFVLAWDREYNGKIERDPSRRLQFRLANDYFTEISKIK